jgi:hypothetical protein
MGTMRVTVKDGWAVYDGNQHVNGGETVTVDTDTANEWLAAGFVTPAAQTRRQRSTPPTDAPTGITRKPSRTTKRG